MIKKIKKIIIHNWLFNDVVHEGGLGFLYTFGLGLGPIGPRNGPYGAWAGYGLFYHPLGQHNSPLIGKSLPLSYIGPFLGQRSAIQTTNF